MKLTNESQLLVKNWDAYQDILKARKGLEKDFSKLLARLAERLQKQEWWDKDKTGWSVWLSGNEFCFSEHKWEVNDNHLIIVGVEYFDPDKFLGDEQGHPLLYVYVTERYPELNAELHKIIKSKKHLINELNPKPADQCIVRKEMDNCLPEEIDTLEERAFKQLSDFCRNYSQLFGEFDKVAQKYL
jgi:hypothetical protein